MALSKFLARPKGRATAVAWAAAADLRRTITQARVAQFPTESLTPQELRRLKQAMAHLAEAEAEVCRALSSLSKRAKEAGFEHPDYATARKLV